MKKLKTKRRQHLTLCPLCCPCVLCDKKCRFGGFLKFK